MENVKPDRVEDHQAAVKELNTILKKAGADRYFTVWVSMTGPTEYVIVDSFAKWADEDRGDLKIKEYRADLQRNGARIVACTDNSRRIIEEILPEYGLPSNGETPKMIRTLQTKVRPDKVSEYLALWKSEVLPAAKKSGLTLFSLA